MNNYDPKTIRLALLQLAVHAAIAGSGDEKPESIVAAAAKYEDFVNNGSVPNANAAVAEEILAEAGVETKPAEEPVVPLSERVKERSTLTEEPFVVRGLRDHEIKFGHYLPIIGRHLNEKLVDALEGHEFTRLLDKGANWVATGPFDNEERNKILKMLISFQKSQGVDLGLQEGDYFCPNCNRIHPAIDTPISQLGQRLGRMLARKGGALSMMVSKDEGEEFVERLKKALGGDVGIESRVITLNPGETTQDAIARHLKDNPLPEGFSRINTDDKPTTH